MYQEYVSTAPYSPGLMPATDQPGWEFTEGGACCDSCADHTGLGFVDPGTAFTIASGAKDLIFGGGRDRHAGAACCNDLPSPGSNPPVPFPKNAGVGGAPTDYRTKGAPWLGPSRHGFTRLKDDWCNCLPIQHNGRWWLLGEVKDGKVYTGVPTDASAAVYVEVDAAGNPINVPGFGPIGPGQWGDASAAPTEVGWTYPDETYGGGPVTTPAPAAAPLLAGVSPLAALLLAGAAAGLLLTQRG